MWVKQRARLEELNHSILPITVFWKEATDIILHTCWQNKDGPWMLTHYFIHEQYTKRLCPLFFPQTDVTAPVPLVCDTVGLDM